MHATNAARGNLMLLVAATAVLIMAGAPAIPSAVQPPAGSTHRAEAYGNLPMHFEANEGQVRDPVKFISRGAGYTLFLSPREAVLTLTRHDAGASKSAALRMALAGANRDPVMAGVDELPGKINYFVGNDPKKWRSNVSTYARVRYAGMYPGIDLVYYGNQKQLEYDFVVAPGANPDSIRLTFEGSQSMALQADGDLVLQTPAGDVRLRKPLAYQGTGVSRREVRADFVLLDRQQVGFNLAPYDAEQPLVIDPVLHYLTYLGGTGSDAPRAIAVDRAGQVYVAGQTDSTDFPTADPFQSNFASWFFFHPDAFVSKLNADGTALVYSTYLGGNHVDLPYGIAVDGDGNAYVTGFTESTDFPTMNALQPTHAGSGGDGFVTRLNADGSALVYSTYIGGTGIDRGNGIAVDGAGNAYITGSTQSHDFPLSFPLQPTHGGEFWDAFVSKLDPEGSAFVYSTYLGGSGGDEGQAIAVDDDGNAFVAGYTASDNFPTADPIQAAWNGNTDGFVSKLNAKGSALTYSTYLGGSDLDFVTGIAVDAKDNIYLAGSTGSRDFPLAKALQRRLGGFQDAFVAQLDATGSAPAYSTYLGGSDFDQATSIALDEGGNVYVAGWTQSSDFPIAEALQPLFGGRGDGFVSKLSAAGSTLIQSTYLGGADLDIVGGIAVGGAGDAYVTGETASAYLPTTNPIQPEILGPMDAFVARITDAPLPGLTAVASPMATPGTSLPVSLSGSNFVDGSTTVTVGGTDVTVDSVAVASPTSLFATVTIGNGASLDARDVTVTTPEGTSNRIPLTIFSSTPGCHVSLPITVQGDPQNASARFGIGVGEEVTGTWGLGLLIFDGTQVSLFGQSIFQGTIPPVAPPLSFWVPLNSGPPVLGVVNAFFNPEMCAVNVAFTPAVSPAGRASIRAQLESALR